MLFQKFIYGNQYGAIEHTFVDGKTNFNALLLSYKKNAFEISASKLCETFEEATDVFSKQQHLFVVINNNKVLSKRIDGTHEFQKSVSIAFSNIKTSDFAVEVLPQQTHSFVAICRNQDVEKILERYVQHDMNVIGLSLGNTAVASLLPYVDAKAIASSNSTIHLNAAQISSIEQKTQFNKEVYTINELNISSFDVLSFSGILIQFSNLAIVERNFNAVVHTLKNEFQQKIVFKKCLKIGLGFIFSLLLINFLLFSSYRDKMNVLSNEQEVNKNYKKTLISLNQKIATKRNLVNEITSAESSTVSLFMDTLGNSVPPTILLTQLQYQPLLKAPKPFKELVVATRTITIAGNSTNSSAYIKWISHLENEDWILELSHMEYGVGKTSKTAFEIQIIARP